MLCGVFIFRGIATTDVAAAQAQAQVDPTVAHLETLFAAFALWLHGLDLIEVGTVFGHHYLPLNHIVD
jgi:hypothetical protein